MCTRVFHKPAWQAFEKEMKGGFGREGNAQGAQGGRERGKRLPGNHCFRVPAY